jgi:DNA-binding response OmpR family regulator
MAERPKLLIVDDDVHIRRLLRIHLKDTPYEIFEAATGNDAETLAAEHQFKVVLLDLVLPYHGGFGLCQRFKSGNQSAYVIMMTGEDSPETRETAREYGADDFVGKPFDARTMRDRVLALTMQR